MARRMSRASSRGWVELDLDLATILRSKSAVGKSSHLWTSMLTSTQSSLASFLSHDIARGRLRKVDAKFVARAGVVEEAGDYFEKAILHDLLCDRHFDSAIS